jgi:predicted ATP-dependent endonuclease of OLD family
MTTKKNDSIRIQKIRIVNYKGIDELEINFTSPKMQGDPDVVVMGSRNGLGKTSVLECCVLLLIALFNRKTNFSFNIRYSSIDMSEMIIRSGASVAQIEGEILFGNDTIHLNIEIDKSGKVMIKGQSEQILYQQLFYRDEMDIIENYVSIIEGMNPNPLISESFLYFHSYRKVQEGNPDLGKMVEKEDVRRRIMARRYVAPMSTFKLRILKSLMSQADLFEEFSDEHSGDVLKKLNMLMKQYAGGTIKKLRPLTDNTVDIRIHPVAGGESFTFDGLSSGQKEIIATLFLIWYQTGYKPGVVLIDEPELHMNPEWQLDFVQQLNKIAPDNQYIIATHSEDIFASVDEDYRFLLQDSTGAKS